MRAARILLAAAFGLAGCSPSAPEGAPRETERALACLSEEFEGADFTRCTADPALHRIRTALAGEDKAPYRDLRRLAEAMGPDARQVAFAVNGGMYDEAGQPIGYYVEGGKRLKTLNRNEGGGNFHLLPNGVFSVEDDGWHVRTADSFAETVRRRPAFATQSGPMLVIGGKLHPKIAADGESRHIRNAVGIDRKGLAHFVQSEQAVSFGKLARYLRDELDVPNALYLDGLVSALWDPARERIDRTVPLGPLIVVENAERDEP